MQPIYRNTETRQNPTILATSIPTARLRGSFSDLHAFFKKQFLTAQSPVRLHRKEFAHA